MYAATLPELVFVPQLHVHYKEAVLRLPDGLPKFSDLPGDMGASRTTLVD